MNWDFADCLRPIRVLNTKEDNELYYNLIKRWHEISGVPIVLNTSFNDREPIVETPEHAINCFLRTDIDYATAEAETTYGICGTERCKGGMTTVLKWCKRDTGQKCYVFAQRKKQQKIVAKLIIISFL